MGLATPAQAQPWDFVLKNATGKAIEKVELSVTGADEWNAETFEADLRGSGEIKVAGQRTVKFDKAASCRYDVKLTFKGDESAIWSKIEVCDNAFVTFQYKNGVPAFSAS